MKHSHNVDIINEISKNLIKFGLKCESGQDIIRVNKKLIILLDIESSTNIYFCTIVAEYEQNLDIEKISEAKPYCRFLKDTAIVKNNTISLANPKCFEKLNAAILLLLRPRLAQTLYGVSKKEQL